MKIRMRGNSIRLRLTKSEVESLQSEGKVLETVKIGSNEFRYELVAIDNDTPLASYSDHTITISLPIKFTTSWFDNDVVGIQHVQVNSDGSELMLLIEKDFACLDNTFEDQSDNYVNPKAC